MRISTFKGELGSHVMIKGLPKKLGQILLSRNKIANPDYETAHRFSQYGRVAAEIKPYLKFAWAWEDEITMHRGCLENLPVKKYGYLKDILSLKDTRTFRRAKFPELRLDLTDEQCRCMASLERTIEQNERPFGNILLVASTAIGKTILQASVGARLGQSCLILCPTDLIMRTWHEDLLKAFGLKRGQIGLVKQAKWDIQSPFTLASIQTLGKRKKKWDEINKRFGTIIVDEVQGCSAPTMWEFLSQSPAAYLVGATATTDTRTGENHHLKALFGSPIVEVHSYHKETATSMPISEVKLVTTDFRYETQVDNLDWNDLALALTGDEDRNKLVVRNIKKEWLTGRTVLVTTKLREHAELLTEMLTEAGITNVNQINGGTNADRFYTTKLLQMVKKRKVTCIVATTQAIKTGANIPTLDSLHIVMPPANARDWEQLLGRIRRKAEGKKEASVTFYFDEKVGYMLHLFKRIIVPVFRKMHIPGYEKCFYV